MRKRDELTHGCMAKASDDEMTFVLLGRDIAAPAAIRAWIDERIRLGKNAPGDTQITEAILCAETMERERGAAATNSRTPHVNDSGDINRAENEGMVQP
jgi:hypothetical protein